MKRGGLVAIIVGLLLGFANAHAGEEKRFVFKGVIPSFDHVILLEAEEAHPNGYLSPQDAWESLERYAQHGTAQWGIAVYRIGGSGNWRMMPIARSDGKGRSQVNLDDLLEIARKSEVRFTHVHTSLTTGYRGDELKELRRLVTSGEIPAPICPPSFGDIMNQMKPLVFEDYGGGKEIEQMKVWYMVTPAGVFSFRIDRNGPLYGTFGGKRYANIGNAMAAADALPSKVLDLVAKVRFSMNMLNDGYSERAIRKLKEGDRTVLENEVAVRKQHLRMYLRLLRGKGVDIAFQPFADQRRWWGETGPDENGL